MNSIETYSPPKVTAIEGEKGEIPDITSDPAALEALRSLLGGITPPLNSGTLPGPVSGTTAPVVQRPNQESRELADLVAELRQSFAKQGDAASKPEVVAQMKTLLQTLESAAPAGRSLPSVSSLPNQMADTAPALGNPLTQAANALPSAPANLLPTAAPLSTLPAPAAADPVADLPVLLQTFQAAIANPPAQTEEAQQALQSLHFDLVKALTAATGESTPVSQPAPAVQTEPAEAAAGLGNAILQSLGSQSSTAAQAAPTLTPALTAERVEHVSALMTQMADRVLVTDPVHGQNPEVRIKLADNVMPGTEVRVWREEGQLRVSFDTTSPHWARVLNEATPLLTQRLNERLPNEGFAQVSVQQQGGQPEDGRSRNRYTAWDLAQQSGEE